MRKLCCVPGCGTGAETPGHKFPKAVATSELWAKAIRNFPLLYITAAARQQFKVCYKHFPQSAYRFGCNRRLLPDAIPSLNLPTGMDTDSMEERNIEESAEVAHFNIEQEEIRETEVHPHEEEEMEMVASVPCIILEDAKNVAQTSNSPLNYFCNLCSSASQKADTITKNTAFTPKALKVFTHIKKLLKQQKYAPKQNKNLRQKLKALNKRSGLQLLDQYSKLSATQRIFIDMQLQTSEYAPQGRRYTEKEKILSLTIYKQSPRSYKLLRQLCNMPSTRTLKNMLQNINLSTGLCKIMLRHLSEEAAKIPPEETYCILMWDEMALQPHLHYDKIQDKVVGVEDWSVRRTGHFADHALVFMLRGLQSGWKIPISYNFFENQTKAPQLLYCIKDAIKKIAATGFKVVATVCDQGTSNVTAINRLVEDTRREKWKRGEKHRTYTFEVNGAKVIPFFDPPHLMKTVRNNLLNKDLEINVSASGMDGKRQYVSWKFIELAYKMESHICNFFRIMTKITDEHVVPQKIKKMKVKYATQVFSNTVAGCLSILSRADTFHTAIGPMQMPNEAESTVEVLRFFDSLFDSVNGHLLHGDKPLRCALSESSEHHSFWTTAVPTLKNMRFVNSMTKEVTGGSACIGNWIKTIENFQELWKELSINGLRIVKTRYVNQDPLENFFGSIRATGFRNTTPTCIGFSGTYKTLLINNLSSGRSNKGNCEDLCSGELLFTLKRYLDQCVSEDLNDEEILNTPISSSNCTTASYMHISNTCIIKQVLQKNGHKECNNCILSCRQASFNDVIIKINKILYRMINDMYFKFKVAKVMKEAVQKRIIFDFIECSVHFESLKDAIVNTAINIFLINWCKRINRMLSGKDTRTTNNAIMKKAQLKYNLRLKRTLQR